VKGDRWLARATTIGAVSAVALAGLFRGNNPDTIGHLAQGRQIAQLGRVPQVDTWSLLPGPPRAWHNYEWLSDLATYALYEKLGDASVTIAKCLLLAVTSWCLTRAAERLSGARAVVLTSLVMVSTLPAIRSRLSDRPHVIGLCLAAVYLQLFSWLGRTARDEGATRQPPYALLAGLFGLHVIWINVHGSHLLGLLITVSFLVLGEPAGRRWVAVALGLQLVASCCSPYGPAIVVDAIDHVIDPRYRALVSEWLPWQEHDPVWLQVGPALHGAMLTLLAPRSWRSSREARAALLVALVLGAACFRSIRFLAEYMLLTSPLLGAGLARVSEKLPARAFTYGCLAGSLSLAWLVPWACARLPPQVGPSAGLSYREAPRAAGMLLSRHGVRPRVFASMQDSWFMMFAAPNCRFAIDGRVPFYGPEHVTRIMHAFAERDVFTILTHELAIDTVIAAHSTSGEQQLTSFVAGQPAWSLVAIEDLHATYVQPGALDLAGMRRFPPLRALEPGYDLGWMLSASEQRSAEARRELTILARLPGTSGYRGWVEGVLLLAPLRRGGASDGFRWPRNASDWDLYMRARPLIAAAAEHAPHVPSVLSLHAAISAVFCDFEQAERAVERATAQEVSREPLLATQEIALRRGRREDVRRVVMAARALPRGLDDPWLAELESGLSDPPSCPASRAPAAH
jgi:hypothetical protein